MRVEERHRPNRLAGEASPYLRQHAGNPVDWYPWADEALARAKAEDRPIFLSIGYAACHWCHVMERESFCDPEIATLLNTHFVAIKVDREERPDLDAVYMAAVQAMTGSGGWPMSVFLTPDLEPFYGGTYFPPERSFGRPSFREVLEGVARAWQERREDLSSGARRLVRQLSISQAPRVHREARLQETINRAFSLLETEFDPQWGGFGPAPKFPSPSRLFLLLHLGADDARAQAMLATTLDGMAAGGMYDWVGGGFHRYSVDDRWLVPHFEKMLYDNALLARLYGEAGIRHGNDRWLRVARETADYLIREMQGPEGAFYASTDADSDGEEGRFFTWTAADVQAALPADEAEATLLLCGLDGSPNFEQGRSVLRPRLSSDALAHRLGVDPEEAASRVTRARYSLLRARAGRPAPSLDDKRLAGWNGLAVWALAYLGTALPDERYLAAAARAGSFLLRELVLPNRTIVRSWRDGHRTGAETLEDVAWVVAGLAALFQSEGDPRWLRTALAIVESRLPRYTAVDGSLRQLPDDGEGLFMRPRAIFDGAIPGPAGVLCVSLLELATITDRSDLRESAVGGIASEAGYLAHNPEACSALLEAAWVAQRDPCSVVVVGDRAQEETLQCLVTAWRRRPFGAVVVPPIGGGAARELVAQVPLLAGRERVAGSPSRVVVCRGGVCLAPVEDRATLETVLATM